MSISLHLKTTILPGGRIEASSPELPQGHSASVFIVVDDDAISKRSLKDVLVDHAAQPSFSSAEEVDAYLKSERDAWDR